MAVARTPFDILHNMNWIQPVFRGLRARRADIGSTIDHRATRNGKTENLPFKEPPIVKACLNQVQPISEPFSPRTHLFFVNDGNDARRHTATQRTFTVRGA
ncbi:hypothetical protein [Paraburkholderia rhizosphaerae]|uniref:hypothetical protein n=1 Tax=Paraburkholderia rhizosphaerae TaxID=480658 RepID=UPI001416EFC6|nr:hypothetical protein [Paraburkholderia rhizosphaerae]